MSQVISPGKALKTMRYAVSVQYRKTFKANIPSHIADELIERYGFIQLSRAIKEISKEKYHPTGKGSLRYFETHLERRSA
jgi:hypothetical protein